MENVPLSDEQILVRIQVNIPRLAKDCGCKSITMKVGLDKPISEIEAAVAKKLKFDASTFGHRVALRYNDPDAGDDLLGSVLLQANRTLRSYDIVVTGIIIDLVHLYTSVKIVDQGNHFTPRLVDFYDKDQVAILLEEIAVREGCKSSDLSLIVPRLGRMTLQTGLNLTEQFIEHGDFLILRSHHKKRQRRKLIKKKKKHATTHNLGVPLEKATGPTKCVPLILQESLGWLCEHGLDAPGIFLSDGDKGEVDELVECYDLGIPVDLDEVADPYVVAELVKEFFTRCPTRVLTDHALDHMDPYFQDVNMPSEKLVDLLLGMLRKLPDESRVVFRALLRTLALVASPDSDNDIDQEHLSILFGPLLVGQMLSTSNASAKRKSLLSPIYKKGTEVVQLLIEHHAEIIGRLSSGRNSIKYDCDLDTNKFSSIPTSQVNVPQLLWEEEMLMEFRNVLLHEGSKSIPGNLYVTNYQLILRTAIQKDGNATVEVVDYDIPLACILHVERKKEANIIRITSKNVRTMLLSCKSMTDTSRLGDFLGQFVAPQTQSSLFGFRYGRGLPDRPSACYNFQKECKRQNISMKHWKIYEEYVTPSYPDQILIPSSVWSDIVRRAATAYQGLCVPTPLWASPSGSMLLTSGVHVEVEGCDTSDVFFDDAKILERAIADLLPNNTYSIVDIMRPDPTRSRPVPTKQSVFQLKDVGTCYKKMLDVVSRLPVKMSNLAEWENVFADAWLSSVSELLLSAVTLALLLRQSSSIMLRAGSHDSFKVITLVLVTIDPYYRTLEGFRVLLDHVWVRFSFPFWQCGGIGKDSSGYQPHLQQCFDAVWQIMRQNPVSFEYNSQFLCFLNHCLLSGRFGDYFGNTNSDVLRNRRCTASLWDLVVENKTMFTSRCYRKKSRKILQIDASLDSLCIWHDCYMRWWYRPAIQALHNAFEKKITTNSNVIIVRSNMDCPVLPYNAVNATTLKELQAVDTGLLEFPEAVLQLTSLTSLDLSNNSIRLFPDHIARILAKSMPSLTTLKLSGNPFLIPKQTKQLTNLSTLFIGGTNQKSDISPVLKLSQLQALNLDRSRIKELPRELSQFQLLKTLSLAHNMLTSLKPFRELKSLEILSLEGNNLRSSTLSHLAKLTALKSLNLISNQLESVPECIFGLTNLKQLLLSQNSISNVPSSIIKLSSLQLLDVSHNNLSSLPPNIGMMREITELALRGNNHLKTPPADVIAEGTDSILRFFRDLLETAEPCYRLRLMLVGQENVGKTTLLRILMKERHAADQNISTDGVDIHELTMTINMVHEGIVSERKVHLSAYDFAGQELYYDTHQFFMDERSVFLVVWNMAEPTSDERVDFWLQSIKARAKSAPVFLVATHTEAFTKDHVSEVLQRQTEKYCHFSNIAGALAVSCTTMKGITELRAHLKDAIAQQPYLGVPVSNQILFLEEELKHMQKTTKPPVLSWASFVEVVNRFKITEEDEVFKAASLLHKFGSIISFADDKKLSDMVILDSHWIAEVMSTLITTKHNFVKAGVLRHSDLVHVWQEALIPKSLHQNLLALLRKFEVLYYLGSELPESSTATEIKIRRAVTMGAAMQSDAELTGRSLIPCLLPIERPTQRLKELWPRFTEDPFLVRHFVFKFVPRGFFSHLMVRFLDMGSPLLYWRNGILARTTDEKVKFLLEIDHSSRTLRFAVRGEQHIQTFLKGVDMVGAFITDWFEIDVRTLSPCYHCYEEQSFDPYMFSFSEMREAAVKGAAYLQCFTGEAVRLDLMAPDLALSEMPQIEFNSITCEAQLGKGAYATVYRGLMADREGHVAVKRFDVSPGADLENVYSEFMREVWIMNGIHHPNILGLVGLCKDPLCIVTEFAAEGDLFTFLHDRQPKVSQSLPLKLKIAFDIAQGMNFLHQRTPPIVHGDLKSPNILLVSSVASDPVVANVADFGLSSMWVPMGKGRKVDNPVWLAPEIIKGQGGSEAGDVYAYGVILFELATCKQFFGEFRWSSQIEDKVLSGERPVIPESVSESFASLIRMCWDQEPMNRPTFDEILARLSRIVREEQESGSLDVISHQESLMSEEERDRAMSLDSPKLRDPFRAHRHRAASLANRASVALERLETLEAERAISDSLSATEKASSSDSSSSKNLKRMTSTIAVDVIAETVLGESAFVKRLKPKHESKILQMVLSLDCKEVWTGCADGSLHVWGASSMERLKIYPAHTGRITSLVAGPNQIWSSSAMDGTVRVWSDEGMIMKFMNVEVLSLCLVQDKVWGGTPEGSIITWDLAKSGQMPRSPTSNRRSASPAPPSPALSRRGTTPAQFKFSGQMSSTNLKKVTRMGIVPRLKDPLIGVPVKSRKKRFKVYPPCFVGSELVDWLMGHTDASTRQEATSFALDLLGEGVFQEVSGSGHGFQDKKNAYYRFTDDAGVKMLEGENTGFAVDYQKAVTEAGSIHCMLYDQEYKRVWVGTDRSIIVLDCSTMKLIMSMREHEKMINELVICKGNIWSCSSDSTVAVWNRSSGDFITKMTGHQQAVNTLCEADGCVWSGSRDMSIIVWSGTTYQFVKELKGKHCDSISSLIRLKGASSNSSAHTSPQLALHALAVGDEMDDSAACVKQSEAIPMSSPRSENIDIVSPRGSKVPYLEGVANRQRPTLNKCDSIAEILSSTILSASQDYYICVWNSVKDDTKDDSKEEAKESDDRDSTIPVPFAGASTGMSSGMSATSETLSSTNFDSTPLEELLTPAVAENSANELNTQGSTPSDRMGPASPRPETNEDVVFSDDEDYPPDDREGGTSTNTPSSSSSDRKKNKFYLKLAKRSKHKKKGKKVVSYDTSVTKAIKCFSTGLVNCVQFVVDEESRTMYLAFAKSLRLSDLPLITPVSEPRLCLLDFDSVAAFPDPPATSTTISRPLCLTIYSSSIPASTRLYYQASASSLVSYTQDLLKQQIDGIIVNGPTNIVDSLLHFISRADDQSDDDGDLSDSTAATSHHSSASLDNNVVSGRHGSGSPRSGLSPRTYERMASSGDLSSSGSSSSPLSRMKKLSLSISMDTLRVEKELKKSKPSKGERPKRAETHKL